MNVFELAELLKDELDELGFNWNIKEENCNPVLRIWKPTKEEKEEFEELKHKSEEFSKLVNVLGV